jgi:hypothetical protein
VLTPPSQKNYANYVERLRPHLERLRALDVNFHPLVVTQ